MKMGGLIYPRRFSDRFKLILIMMVGNLIVFVSIAAFSYGALSDARNRSDEVQLLQKGVFELSALAQDYFDFRSKRALRQWHDKYASVHSLVVNLSINPTDDMEVLSHLGRTLSELRDLLNNFKDNEGRKVSSYRKAQVSSYSRYLAHDISAMILNLSQSTSAALRKQQLTTWAVLLIYFLLSKLAMASITIVMWRRSDHAMAALKSGIQDISDGKVPQFEGQADEDFGAILGSVSTLGEKVVEKQLKTLEELRNQRQIAEQASQAKSAFLANISHEIRTPLSIIDGYTNMLISKGGEPKKDYLAKIHWNVKYIVKLVNEILDLSKIEEQKMVVNYSPFHLVDLKPLFESMEYKSKQSRLNFQIKCLSSLPIEITSDQTRIEQILINLIGNAIKYTKAGGVEVRIGFKEPWLIFEVEDTGIGLTPEQVNQIFSPFYQANPTRYEGTGLGLALSVKMAELLGGTVYLKRTELNKGSTFVFELPLREYSGSHRIFANSFNSQPEPQLSFPAPSTESTVARPLSGYRILVAEDNEDLREITELILNDAGASVTFAEDGTDVVDLVVRQGRKFDLILMDIQMKTMDGYTACREIRKSDKESIIVACSAHVLKEEKNKGLAAGMNAYIEKPLNIAKIIKALGAINSMKSVDESASFFSV